MKIADIGEFGLIDLLAGRIPPVSGRVIKGIGDDTAVLKLHSRELLLLTTDMLVEDVHFSLSYCPLRSVGWKALAVNISDIAAMGGQPNAAVVSIGIPSRLETSQVEEIYHGLGECARQYGVDIVGGDTVKSPERLILNVALTGTVEPDRVVYRSGARPGDLLMVTGPLGRSAAGLVALSGETAGVACDLAEEVVHTHLRPWARVREGRILGQTGLVTSMNDISDGLASEILEICRASGTGCEVDAESIPYTDAVAGICKQAGASPLDWALYGGEDFELVFTVRPDGVDKVRAALGEAGCVPAAVGKIVSRQSGCSLIRGTARCELTPGGYDHFRE